MSNNKTTWLIVGTILFISLVLIYVFRPLTMNDILDKPSFNGVVTQVNKNTIIVAVDEDEDEYKSSDVMSVSLDVQLNDNITQFEVGDMVQVFYDGSIAESYPAQINTVFAILLIEE